MLLFRILWIAGAILAVHHWQKKGGRDVTLVHTEREVTGAAPYDNRSKNCKSYGKPA